MFGSERICEADFKGQWHLSGGKGECHLGRQPLMPSSVFATPSKLYTKIEMRRPCGIWRS